MRLRNAAIAASSALTLLLAVPGSAVAATGEFAYTYRDLAGEHHGRIMGPRSGQCLDLVQATADEAAAAPRNRTGSTATAFLDFGCQGDTFYALRPGAGASERLKVRSVVFS